MSKVDSFGQDFMAVNFTAVKFQYKSTTFFSHEGGKKLRRFGYGGKKQYIVFYSLIS
jgi:hypothetical protein